MKNIIFILILIPSLAFAAPLKMKFKNLPDPISVEEGKSCTREMVFLLAG